jgi:hypothetical protein
MYVYTFVCIYKCMKMCMYVCVYVCVYEGIPGSSQWKAIVGGVTRAVYARKIVVKKIQVIPKRDNG